MTRQAGLAGHAGRGCLRFQGTLQGTVQWTPSPSKRALAHFMSDAAFAELQLPLQNIVALSKDTPKRRPTAALSLDWTHWVRPDSSQWPRLATRDSRLRTAKPEGARARLAMNELSQNAINCQSFTDLVESTPLLRIASS